MLSGMTIYIICGIAIIYIATGAALGKIDWHYAVNIILVALGVIGLKAGMFIDTETSFAQECSDCPYEKPCIYSYPAGDGCNSCSGETWCINGKWYTSGTGLCTLKACRNDYEIPHPFKKNLEQLRKDKEMYKKQLENKYEELYRPEDRPEMEGLERQLK